MVKILATKFKNSIKKNKYLPLILILLFVLFLVFLKISYSFINSINYSNEGDDKFSNINNYILSNKDSEILKRVDSDLRPLLSKNFGKTKLDKNLMIKSNSRNSWHIFYFSKKSPKLENFQTNVILNIEKLGYIKKDYPNIRTYKYNLNFQGNTYSIIINLLSYNNDDTPGIYMVYIEKV